MPRSVMIAHKGFVVLVAMSLVTLGIFRSNITLGVQDVAVAPIKVATSSIGLGSLPLWDTAWTLNLARRPAIETYLAARRHQGFDVVLYGYGDFGTRNTPLGDGERPFLANLSTPRGDPVADVLQPNSAAWSYVDATVSQAKSLGLVVAFLPLGNTNATRYITALSDQSPGENRASRYGQWIGNRYKHATNLIWVLGGDVDISSPEVVTLTNHLAAGLESTGTAQPITFHPGWHSSSAGFQNQTWLAFNAIQEDNPVPDIAADLALTPRKPTGVMEEGYETSPYQHGATADDVLSETWRAYLAGAAYVAYGQARMQQGQNPALTDGIRYSRIARDLVAARGWRSYTPTSDFIASSHGTIAAMRKSDTAAMIYLGRRASVMVSMSHFNATGYLRVQRFDPRTGSLTTLGVFVASAKRSFNGGGLMDTVILLDAVTP
jgi:hypothetical protein